MTNRTVVAPPSVPGAHYVGSKACAECHENITSKFHDATHAKLMANGENAKNIGCESCHGPGSEHVKAGGGPGTIINPNNSPETCYQCHLDKRGEFNLPYSHPVASGKMTCGDCHNPHEGDAVPAGGVASLEDQNATCLKCHVQQGGPYVFEHEALREGCVTCHSPHGSMNAKMLKSRNANLCLQCHFQEQKAGGIVIGGRDHSSFLNRGTCWSAGCHEAVHGSNGSAHFRF
jgi:predicted CXXCH cytochrome family protein